MKPPSGPKKQTQNKPNFRKAKINLKSLAGKSGHTQRFRHPKSFLHGSSITPIMALTPLTNSVGERVFR